MTPEPGAPATGPDPAVAAQARADWYAMSAAEAADALASHVTQGLTADEARARLQRHGPNAIAEQPPMPLWRMLLGQFRDFTILVLIAAAAVSGVVGEAVDTAAILVIVVLNAAIGALQQWRAQRAIAALRRLAASRAVVVRGGAACAIAAAELVPGDLVLLEAGDVVPADLRLVEAVRLRTEEAALTGEPGGIDKQSAPLTGTAVAIGDRANMAWKGTAAASGRGSGLVVATGMATELGRIAAQLGGAGEQPTPLQQRLARFGQRLALAVLAICAVVFGLGVLRGEPTVLMFLTAVSLAVAAIPEALPAVVTIALAVGARRMVGQNALVRRLPAVETLGSVTWICSDKTGTLTENRMRVEALFADGHERHPARSGVPAGPVWDALFLAMALNNDCRVAADGSLQGEPTERALLEAARATGLPPARIDARPRVAEVPFDSERKRMSTVHSAAGEAPTLWVKGAPESVLPLCVRELRGEGERPADHGLLLERAERMAREGLRIMAFARRELAAVPPGAELAAAEQALVFVGFAGLIDPPRAEAADAVAACRGAGIVPVMITGDHPATARSIARRLGILDGEGKVLTGERLAWLSDQELAAEIDQVRVFARVDPAQKIRIVRALQARGEFVAMTGDGVNDAPALQQADIGVAMGRIGTDVAREAAHMVLLDDNFATIVAAVREGRRIYDNIRKFVKYSLTGNVAQIWVLLLAPFFGLPLPLVPVQILWINLLTDSLPGLALVAEPARQGIMQQRPRPPGESLFAGGIWQHALWGGLLVGGMALAAQAWGIQEGNAAWQTMVFTGLVFAKLALAMSVRSEHESLFTLGFATNRHMLASVAAMVALQLAAVYVPWFNALFHTTPLSAAELAACAGSAVLLLALLEAEKALVRRGRLPWSSARPGR